jgi:hypothetical protein
VNKIDVISARSCGIDCRVLNLTRHEQKVLWVVLALIVIGLAARLYRGTLPLPSGHSGAQTPYATS